MVSVSVGGVISTAHIDTTILARQVLKDRAKGDAVLLQVPLGLDGDVGVGGAAEGDEALLWVHGDEVGRVGNDGSALLALEDDRAENVPSLVISAINGRRWAGQSVILITAQLYYLGQLTELAITSGTRRHHQCTHTDQGIVMIDNDDNINTVVEDSYRVLKRLGAATSSQLLIARHRKTNQDVVIKVFNGTSVPREVETLRKLSHPSIVSLYQSFATSSGTYCMVMPMLGRREMDLFEFIEEYGPLNESVISHIFAQVVSAIIYLHSCGIAHCDIKVPNVQIFTLLEDENVVIDADTLSVQLIDFGSARGIDEPVGLEDITISYAPPQVYTNCKLFARELDCWCLGVLLFTMMYSKSPFSSSYDAQSCIMKIDKTRHSDCTPFDYAIIICTILYM